MSAKSRSVLPRQLTKEPLTLSDFVKTWRLVTRQKKHVFFWFVQILSTFNYNFFIILKALYFYDFNQAGHIFFPANARFGAVIEQNT